MKILQRIAAFLLVCLLAFSQTVGASAATGNVTYTGDAGKFIFEPGSKYSPTDLFPNFKDVMPGDSISQRIVLKNEASQKVKIKVYMRARGAHPGSEEFLSQLHLRVEKVTDTVMFDAAADRTAQLTDWVCLGTLYSGGEVELKAILDVPTTLDNTNQDRVGFLDWEFAVKELPIEPTDPEPPQTGDDSNLGLYILLLAASGVLMAAMLFLLRRKKQDPQT